MKLKKSWETIAFMAAVHILAVVALFNFSWAGFTAFLVLYYATACLGVTLGYHRLLTHRSFKAPIWLRRVLATFGALSAEYGPVTWVGLHRQHHLFSDKAGDPHDSTKGFWWAHIGWMLHEVPAEKKVEKYAADIRQDPYMVFLDTYFLWLNVIVGAGLWFLWGPSALLWGVFMRLAFVYHVTWLVNSAAHYFGERREDSKDNSRNNWWVALLTFGEGNHANHHADESKATVGGYDPTWLHIYLLRELGLATNVRV